MEFSIYIARQPIFDKKGGIFAYELLYRDTDNNSANVSDNLHATSRVLVNTLNYIGLNTLTHGLTAFVKVDESVLKSEIIHAIAPAYFVLEILESTLITPELILRIEELHAKGYRFALNQHHYDNRFTHHIYPLLEISEYVKIDMNRVNDLKHMIVDLKEYKCRLIAEKIEDEESFKRAESYGFTYFQGYYFCTPDLLDKEQFDPDSSLLLDLLYLLKTKAPLDKLLAKFDTSAYLTINLLKVIQLNEGFVHDSISSIEQALLLIGRERLSCWLELMLYADGNKNFEINKQAAQITRQALQRACLMEELAYISQKNTHFSDMAYITGMLSISEIMFHVSYRELTQQTVLDEEIVNALLHKKGVLGRLLELAVAIEKNDSPLINAIAVELDISERKINECLLNSYQKSSAVLE